MYIHIYIYMHIYVYALYIYMYIYMPYIYLHIGDKLEKSAEDDMSAGSTSSSGGAGGSGASYGGSSGSIGAGGGPCGACKFLRRKCVTGCIFAPYFDSEQGAAHFAAVHKVFGASNVSKLLIHIPAQKRLDAVVTICYEAQSRLRDPVYGCVAQIFALQQQVMSLQAELSCLQTHLATLELPIPPSPPPPLSALSQPNAFSMPVLSSTNLPSHSAIDLSSLFNPQLQIQHPPQQNHSVVLQPPQQLRGNSMRQSAEISGSHDGDDLHALARELIERNQSSPSDAQPTAPMQP